MGKLHFKPYSLEGVTNIKPHSFKSNKLNPEVSKSNKLNLTISKVTN